MTIASALPHQYERTSWWLLLTGYREFVLFRGPIVIEKRLKIDDFVRVSVLCPK